MRQINLLPSELKPSKKLSIAVKKIEKYLIAMIVFYLLIIASSYFALKYFDGKLSDLGQQKSSLSSEIKSLTAVETSTIAIRDRVQKYLKLQNKDAEKKGLELFEKLYLDLPVTSTISNIQISEGSLVFSIKISDTPSFLYTFENFTKNDFLKGIEVSAISYKPSDGYSFFVSAVY